MGGGVPQHHRARRAQRPPQPRARDGSPSPRPGLARAEGSLARGRGTTSRRTCGRPMTRASWEVYPAEVTTRSEAAMSSGTCGVKPKARTVPGAARWGTLSRRRHIAALWPATARMSMPAPGGLPKSVQWDRVPSHRPSAARMVAADRRRVRAQPLPPLGPAPRRMQGAQVEGARAPRPPGRTASPCRLPPGSRRGTDGCPAATWLWAVASVQNAPLRHPGHSERSSPAAADPVGYTLTRRRSSSAGSTLRRAGTIRFVALFVMRSTKRVPARNCEKWKAS